MTEMPSDSWPVEPEWKLVKKYCKRFFEKKKAG
jgi:hypothetical protein